jgi:hypothetical protein
VVVLLYTATTTAASVTGGTSTAVTVSVDATSTACCTVSTQLIQPCSSSSSLPVLLTYAQLHTQVEFVVLVDKAGTVVVAPENSALDGIAWDPANIVNDVLSTGNLNSISYRKVLIQCDSADSWSSLSTANALLFSLWYLPPSLLDRSILRSRILRSIVFIKADTRVFLIHAHNFTVLRDDTTLHYRQRLHTEVRLLNNTNALNTFHCTYALL